MIYIGNKETQSIYGGTSATSAVYIGSFLTFPTQYTYVLSDAALHYSSGSTIDASGSNYAYIDATVRTYRNGTLIKTETNVKLAPYKITDTTGAFVILNNEIHCNSRGTITGSTRSATFKGYYQNLDVSTGTLTVQQMPNYAVDHEKTLQWIPEDYGKVTYLGGDIQIYGQKQYEYWTTYTSGASTSHSTSWDYTTATSYDFTGVNWITYSPIGSDYIHVNNNNTSLDRDASITAKYKGAEDTTTFSGLVNVSQWKKSYTVPESRTNEFFMDPSLFNASDYGPSKAATLNISVDYRINTWTDGNWTYGSWTEYHRDDEDDLFTLNTGSSSIWKFAKYSDLYTEYYYYVPIQWMYDYNKARYIGKAYIYPSTENTGTTDVEASIEFVSSYWQDEINVVQKGSDYYISIPATRTITASTTSATINVTTNVPSWTVSKNGNWFSVTKRINSVLVSCSQNTGSSARTGTIIVSGSGKSASCVLTQTANLYIDLWFNDSTQITQYQEFQFSDSYFMVKDRGNNNHNYIVTFNGDTLSYTISNNEIYFTDVTSSTETEISVYETSSGQTRIFRITGE